MSSTLDTLQKYALVEKGGIPHCLVPRNEMKEILSILFETEERCKILHRVLVEYAKDNLKEGQSK